MTAAKIRWGLIGCGDIARKRVAPALRDLPNCELVAVSRAKFELAESFAKEFGARRWYDTWEGLISDEEVDAVYIATPVHLHAAQTIAAAQAGKHVLCEKPMAMNVGECDQMIAACAEHQVRLGVSYYRHFYPVVGRVRQILASGEIGAPVLAQINAFEWFNPDRSHARRWLIEKELSGGGPMFDFGCHRLEVLINLFGRVSRISSQLSNSIFEREVEDTATALLGFESGAQAILSVTHAATEPQDTLHIFGTEGSIHVPELNAGVLTLTTRNGQSHESHPAPANLHLPLIDDFVQALISNRDPQVDGAAGREVAKIEAEIYSQGARS
jgi:predicted dehydrogenase